MCAFSNHDGGHIFLGVKDNGNVVGIQGGLEDRMKKEFVQAVNNASKISPPLFVSPEEYDVDGKTIIYINVPVGEDVCRCVGKIYDRDGDSDIDITARSYDVYRLYARKHEKVYVDRVTGFGMEDLRHDLFERARRMTRLRSDSHPWWDMTDEEILRSTGLILRDSHTDKEGITLAAVLLFGTDMAIMSAFPYYKTDALVRIVDTDRYDDRDVVITNLIESYDRLLAFGKRHLNSPFRLDGVISVDCRGNILREILSNLLAHRDFASEYVAKFVIEKEQVYTENASRSRGQGRLDLQTFTAQAKNPPIAKVFREIGMADELGSGMRNTYKYTRLYSNGAEPQFLDGTIFRTVIPLTEVATIKAGPTKTHDAGQETEIKKQTDQDTVKTDQDTVKTDQDTVKTDQDTVKTDQDVQLNRPRKGQNKIAEGQNELIKYCSIPRSRQEMQRQIGVASKVDFRENYLNPLIADGKIRMTLPEAPSSRNQKYVKV